MARFHKFHTFHSPTVTTQSFNPWQSPLLPETGTVRKPIKLKLAKEGASECLACSAPAPHGGFHPFLADLICGHQVCHDFIGFEACPPWMGPNMC